jgi:hypothetical protein
VFKLECRQRRNAVNVVAFLGVGLNNKDAGDSAHYDAKVSIGPPPEVATDFIRFGCLSPLLTVTMLG